MATLNDIAASSLRLIGVLASGETPSGNEIADCLTITNQMLDAWSIERLNIFTLDITELPLIPGTQTYTLGTGGTLNMARPNRIERMSIVNLNNPAQPLELPLEMLTDAGWQAVPVKLINSTLPIYVYDDGAFPFRNLSFWPVPSIPVNIRIYSWEALRQFPDVTTDVTFPPGYLKAIRYNLAVDLAPEFGRSVPPEVAAQAMLTKGAIKSINQTIVESTMPAEIIGPRARIYDWRSDMWRSR